MKQYQAHVILRAFKGSIYPAAKITVEADSELQALDQVFSQAQNIDSSWIDQPNVIAVFEEYKPTVASPRPEGLRSLSVGDRVHLIGHGAWECLSFGWQFMDAGACWVPNAAGTQWELSAR